MSSSPVLSMELARAVAAARRARVRKAREADPWRAAARLNQVTPAGDWTVWLRMAGRGEGKTRSGAEFIREEVMAGRAQRVALVARTAADTRDVMVEGESGLLACCERYLFKADYQSSKRRVIFGNGAKAYLYSAQEPALLRGPQHDCFVAGTMIEAPDGPRPIESLAVGDAVLTRFGVRRVAEIRSKLAAVGTVTFSNGSSLRGTSQHPVLQPHGWTKLADLSIGGAVCTGSQRPTDTSRPTGTAARSTSTAGSGSSTTAPSRPAIISTTGTATRQTTISRIWSWSIPKRISSITRMFARRRCCLAADAVSWSPENGTDPLRSAHPASPSSPSAGERPSAHAQSAERSSAAAVATSVASVVSTWADDGPEVVYNLTVETDHEFIANSIVVHNCAWADEVGAWTKPDAWDQLQFGLRLHGPQGNQPRMIATTTPRPTKTILKILKRAGLALSTGTTYDNRANLAESFFEEIISQYEGTRLGRQELMGELLNALEGALWSYDQIDALRVDDPPAMARVVVAVDPPASDGPSSAECGIVVVGLGIDRHGYVLADYSLKGSPNEWGNMAYLAAREWDADTLVIETNQGGEMAIQTLRTVGQQRGATRRIVGVHASKGKLIRAEPVAALYEQRRVFHVTGDHPKQNLSKLEDQMCSFLPEEQARQRKDDTGEGQASPDRLDALVWGITNQLVKSAGRTGASV